MKKLLLGILLSTTLLGAESLESKLTTLDKYSNNMSKAIGKLAKSRNRESIDNIYKIINDTEVYIFGILYENNTELTNKQKAQLLEVIVQQWEMAENLKTQEKIILGGKVNE